MRSGRLKELNLNHLLTLDAVLEHRNLTRAAEQLGLTQGAVSQSLARLRAFFNDAISWEIVEDITFNGGLRYTEEHKDYTFFRSNRDGTLNPFLGALDGVTGEFNGDRIDWRANLQYRVSEELMTYVQVSTGFKGGGINPRPFNPAQVQPFGPETLTSYELGFKSDLFGRIVRLNGAVFFSDYQDIQLTLLSCPQFGGPGPCALPQNAGDAEIKGIELEATIDPGNGLLIDGAMSYLDFDYSWGQPPFPRIWRPESSSGPFHQFGRCT